MFDRIQNKAPRDFKRSKKWRAFRKGYLQGYSECFCCGRQKKWFRRLEAHHIVPIYEQPDLELSQTNLIPLCNRCHLLIGHLGSWEKINLEAASYASNIRDKIEQYTIRAGMK